MAPLPPNSTQRYFLDYSTDKARFTMEMRTIEGFTPEDASTAFDALLGAVSPALAEISVEGMRVSTTGSDVSIPAPYSGVGTFGSGPQPQISVPVFVSFVGRTLGARRSRVTVFGVASLADASYRITTAEQTWVLAALAALEANPDAWLAIDGLRPIWNNYANTGANAYRQRRARRASS